MAEDSLVSKLIREQNGAKLLFTPGPASLTMENILGLGPAFGRGDSKYDLAELEVLQRIANLAGQDKVVRLQGAASLAIEVAVSNFLFGKVVVIDTGYYSERVLNMVKNSRNQFGFVREILEVPWERLDTLSETADWLVAIPVETSRGLGLPISEIKSHADRIGAKLMLDATASIGLQDSHDLADVLAFSSCKGLFGLTGAAFIAYTAPPSNDVPSFSLDISSYSEKRMTGPYHAVLSLVRTLRVHEDLKHAVIVNKEKCTQRFKESLVFPSNLQPLLCTGLYGNVRTKNKDVVLYEPRGNASHSVVCHLGEVHLGKDATGEILQNLYIESRDKHEP